MLPGIVTQRRDVGLSARLSGGPGDWRLVLSCRRAAYYVTIGGRTHRPGETHFHLVPGHEKSVRLFGPAEGPAPSGTVAALNAERSVDYAAAARDAAAARATTGGRP